MKRLILLWATIGMALPARAAPSVVSDTDCPSAAAVQFELADLAPGPTAEVRIRSTGHGLTVELASEGEPLRSRDLHAEGDCAVRARAAALVAASWLDALPAQPPNAPEPSPTPRPAPTSHRLWLGLGAFGLVDDVGANAGALGDVQLGAPSGVNLGLTLALPLARDTPVGQGTAHVWRPSAELTLRWPLGQGAWSWEPGWGAVVGYLRVQGRGYDHNKTDTMACWGARAQLRAQRTWDDHRVWIELAARWWPFKQDVRNDESNSSASVARTLPRWDGQLAVGFSFAAF